MKVPRISFLLVPDSGAGRRVRRLLAEHGACAGVVAGTWLDLLEWARRAYLVPEPADDWDEMFRNALLELEDAFWSASLSVAPDETQAAVESALLRVLTASNPGAPMGGPGVGDLPSRLGAQRVDLSRLQELLSGRLPPELSVLRALLSADAHDAISAIQVCRLESTPFLTVWQAALVDKLNHDAGSEPESDPHQVEFRSLLEQVLQGGPGKPAAGALTMLQSRLFCATASKAPLDASVQWLAGRDFMQEAELAAGMAQNMLTEDPKLAPADIGVLLPDSFEYALAVEDAFGLGGLALSGLPVERWRRDLGGEAVFHFLYCRQKPAPAMAFAACLSSPLMPWSREDGAVLAQCVMDGDYRLSPLSSAGSEARAMLSLLREGDDEPRTLAQALQRFVTLLDGGSDFSSHIHQAARLATQLCAALESAADIDWAGLRRRATPRFITSGASPDFNQEGITIWHECQEPWRPVRHLLVLGFAEGHYPAPVKPSPVFSAEDLAAVREHMSLPIRTPSDELAARRERFRRQLCAAAESVSFLVPRRDPAGIAQAPSESLVFMRQLFTQPAAADDFVLELDVADERARVRHLPLAEPQPPRPPRAILVHDMHFERDLLALGREPGAGRKPESPSSLETLMVSELAWLLRRLQAEPLQWAPEAADVTLLGRLAHQVFEGLFRPGFKLPARAEITARANALLYDAISRLAPFLRGTPWQVERRHLAAETARAAQVWRDVLEQLGAEILASEVWLQGSWSGVAVHGQADLIVGLPDNQLLVVDYKRASSRGRRTRMERGYDSQASLYRAMLQSGTPESGEVLGARLRKAGRTGIVYFMLNDRVALSDSAISGAGKVPGWDALDNDVASAAMALIRRRVAELGDGRIRLNRSGDQEFFEKQAGVKPYALYNSPLIGLFTLPGDSKEHP